jgi:D-glycero-D-manno-heptose 1,7-bisphosphate phosphatase
MKPPQILSAARRAVFLDRDGVINRSLLRNGKPVAPRSLEEFEILPGVPEAIRRLAEAGFLIFVATNQPDIGNGLVDPEIVERMHRQLLDQFPITKIYCCPHRQDAGCACRKPRPGMLLAAAREFGVNLAASFMVGDRYSDVQAAEAAGCTPVFIDYKYVETPDFPVKLACENLLQAGDAILQSIVNAT